MKTTYVFTESGMTIYPSIAMAEKNLGVKALRRTLNQHHGTAYIGEALVIAPQNDYDYEYIDTLTEAFNEGLGRLFL